MERERGAGSSSSASLLHSTPASMAAAGIQSPANSVFVYGSLMAHEVVQVLLKRVPYSAPAILDGYHRYRIKGRVYPAILPVESKKVDGKVLQGITDLELDILDTFEDIEYERNTVEVTMTDSLEKVTAYAYVWKNENDQNLYGEWNFDEWKQQHMRAFVEMSIGFMEEREQSESKTRVEAYESYFQES